MSILALRCLNISFNQACIEVEEGGVYRVTTRSLTGMGTHTRWYYPDEPEFRQECKNGIETVPTEGRRLVSFTQRTSCIDGTLSTISSRETTPGIEVEQDNEHFDGYDTDSASDTTEIFDEEAEAEEFRRLRISRDEEPLPKLPYERIMMRISQEPTVILNDA